jgi:glycosyltransferase involved in cell wall biosynthesis
VKENETSVELSVVVPTHQRPKPLARLLASLSNQSLKRGQFEVIVVFNLPEPFDHLNEFKEKILLRHVTVGKKGLNRARNRGVSEAKGKIVLILDDDEAAADPHLLESHLEFHTKNPTVSVLGGAYRAPSGLSAMAFAYQVSAMAWAIRYTDGNGHSACLLGGHVSYKSSLFKDGLCFDERIIFGGTETELHMRLFNGGHVMVFRPEIFVFHFVELSMLGMFRKGFLQGKAYADRELSGTIDRPKPHLRHGDAIAKALDIETNKVRLFPWVRLGWWIYDFAHKQGKYAGQGKLGLFRWRSLIADRL